MKFSIKKSIILEQLVNVNRAISPKNIIPILNGIKFDLDEQGLQLTASDSDLTIKSLIKPEDIETVDKEGSIVIQAKYIIDIVKSMPGEIINFEVVDGSSIIIYCNNTKYNLNCLNSNDYPQIQMEENKNSIKLKGEDLKRMIKQTIFAVSTQESRPLLTGVNININGNILEFITTDSYRLAKKTFILEENFDEAINIVVPGRNMNELDKIVSDASIVEIHVFNNKILFKIDNILFQSNLLNGQYPNTSNFIPKEFKYIITTNLNNFYASIDRAALLTQSKERNIVKMEANENKLCISSISSEIGKVEDYLDVERNNDEQIVISFSAKYMIDALRTFENDDITIFMNGDSAPIVIKSNSDESLIQLILPIKTY
jgi:DNA polymerase-3 subunit beta